MLTHELMRLVRFFWVVNVRTYFPVDILLSFDRVKSESLSEVNNNPFLN